jgi:tRNA threonylcarbamoyladenosine biosynthesis protein TsaE
MKYSDLEQTQKLAEQLAKNLYPGAVLALNGELGSGKTTFVRFLARACGLTANVRSPTFNLLNIYPGKMPFYHFDFYRLNNAADLENIGGTEFIPSPDGVTLIEWAEKIPEALPEDYLEIKISADNELSRVFSFISHGHSVNIQL